MLSRQAASALRLPHLTALACACLASLGAACSDDATPPAVDAGPDAGTDLDPAQLQGVWELDAVPAPPPSSSCTIGVESCLRWELTGSHFDAIGRLFNGSGTFQVSGGELAITDTSVDPPRQLVTSWRVEGADLYTGVLTPVGAHDGLVGTWSSRDTRGMPAPAGSGAVVTALELRADGTYTWTLDSLLYQGTYTASDTRIDLTGDGPVVNGLEVHAGWLWGAPTEGARFVRR